jgi:hypothetical protein
MSWAQLARALSLRRRDGRQTATASKRLWNIALRPGQGMGLWRPAGRGRQVAHLHLALEELQELPEATAGDRAGYPTGPYLPDRRQSKDPRQRPGKEVARRAPEDETRFHSQRSGVAQPHRGVVAYIPQTSLCRAVLRGQLRDRPSHESRHPAAEPESQPVGMGATTQIAEASEAYVCVPPLRNGALRRSGLRPDPR